MANLPKLVADILGEVDWSNEILETLGMFGYFSKVMHTICGQEHGVVQLLDGLHMLLDFIEAELGLANIIDGPRQLFQVLHVLGHLIVAAFPIHAVDRGGEIFNLLHSLDNF